MHAEDSRGPGLGGDSDGEVEGAARRAGASDWPSWNGTCRSLPDEQVERSRLKKEKLRTKDELQRLGAVRAS